MSRLTFSQTSEAISSRRMAVSSAKLMHGASFSLAAASRASSSPGASLRFLPRLTFGLSTFSVEFPRYSMLHVVRARLKTCESAAMSSRIVFPPTPSASLSRMNSAMSARRMAVTILAPSGL